MWFSDDSAAPSSAAAVPFFLSCLRFFFSWRRSFDIRFRLLDEGVADIATLEEVESRRSITLTGIRRIRKRRNYRERPVYVMDNKSFYINIISRCEEMLERCAQPGPGDVAPIIDAIKAYEADCESFALRHQRYAVLGLSIQDTGDLYQIASHYLDDFPEQQAELSKALHNNLYQIDIFLSEADTLIAKDKFRIGLGSHDAYGIDTVRNPPPDLPEILHPL